MKQESQAHTGSKVFIKKIANKTFCVPYAGSDVVRHRGSTFYTDTQGNVIVGWHGSTNPLMDMVGNSMVYAVKYLLKKAQKV